MSASDYEQIEQDNAPPWLAGPWGLKAWSVWGAAKDRLLSAHKTAVKLRFPALAHPDALRYLLEDRNLLPRWGENDATVRARLLRAWTTWANAGTATVLTDEITFAGATVDAILEAATSFPTLTGAAWYFWVIVHAENGAFADGAWGDAGTWGDGGAWAYGVRSQLAEYIKAIIRKFSPLHARCESVVVVGDNARLWDYPTPTDTWGSPGRATWDDVGLGEISYVTVN